MPTLLKINISDIHRGQHLALYVAEKDTELLYMTDNTEVVWGKKRLRMLVGTATCPQTDWLLSSFGFCARNRSAPRLRVCSLRVRHQSCFLLVPHCPVGSSPPAAVETSVWVPGKWGAQICERWGSGPDAAGSF